jgi:hypothetical protein
MQKAAADVDKLTGAQERQARTTKNLNASIEDAKTRFHAYSQEVKGAEGDMRATEKSMRSFANEFDRLAGRAKAGSDVAQSLRQMATDARKAAEVAAAAQREQTAVQKIETDKRIKNLKQEANASEQEARRVSDAQRKATQEAREAQRAADDRSKASARAAVEAARQAGREAEANLKVQQSQRALMTSIEDTLARFDVFNGEVERGEHSSVRAASGYRQFARELGTLQNKFDAGSEASLVLGESINHARTRAEDFTDTAKRAGRETDNLHNSFLKLFGVDSSKLDAINQRIGEFERQANKSRFAVAALDNRLRGLVVVGIIAFFQQLVSAVIAVGGALGALAANAVQAGIALAGMAASGAAQVLPVLGLLAAAWGRVGAVFKAVQQSQKEQAQAGFDQAQSADRQRTAARALENAQQGVADAHRRVTDAQQALNKAREDGVRQVEDLTAAERQAELQAEQALQAQLDARRSLRQAIRSGDIDQQANAELGLKTANQGVTTAGTALARAREDKAAVGGNVENLDSVKSAARALQDASRSVGQAEQAFHDASRASGETVKQIATAQRLLDQMLAQLSPAERRLFEVTNKIATYFHDVWSRRVLTPIIDSFTFGAKQVLRLLKDPKITAAARDLSKTIAGQLDRVFKFLSSPETVSFFSEMAREAKRNLPVVVSGLMGVLHIFENIARAGGPALHRFLVFLEGLISKADDATSGNGGITKLRKFFDRGEKYLESWVKLGGAVARLFLAIVGVSAGKGQDALKSITDAVNRATEWVNSHRKDIQKFLDESLHATGEILKAVGVVAVALFGLFQPGEVESFAKAITTVLVPVLSDVAQILGHITKFITDLLSNKIISAFAQVALTALLLSKALSPFIRLGGRLVVLFGQMIGSAKLVAAGLGAIEILLSPIGAVIVTVAGVVLLLHDRFHSLGDVLKTLGTVIGVASGIGLAAKIFGFGNVFKGVLKHVENLISRIPVLNRLLKRGAGAASVGGAAKTGIIDFAEVGSTGTAGAARTAGTAGVEAEGSRAGKLFGGRFARSAKTLIANAGWIGVGVSAVAGIVSGFKYHSVDAGIRDFFHTVSFGLIDSFEEAAHKAGDRMAAILKKRLSRPDVLPTLDVRGLTARPNRQRQITIDDLFGRQRADQTIVQGGRGAPAQARGVINGLTSAGKQIELLRERYGKSFDGFLSNLAEFVNRFRKLVARKDGLGLELLMDDLREFRKTAPPEFQGALDAMLARAKDVTSQISERFKGVTRDVRGNWSLLSKNTKATFDDIREHIKTNMGIIKLRLGRDSADGRKAMSQNFKDAADAVQKQMDRGVIKTQEGTREIRKLMIRSLTALGLSPQQAIAKLDHGTLDVNPNLGTHRDGSVVAGHVDRAGGGWAGGSMPGERGADGTVLARLGRGEAVLNWAHQNLVEPAVRAMYGFGLDGLFKKIRGKHGPEVEGGYARGGYVQGAIAPASTPNFIQRLFGMGFNATSALRPGAITTSGNVSDHASGHAWDFGDSANNIRRLWRTVFPLRSQIKQLIGPSYVSHGTLYDYGAPINIAGSKLQADHEDHIHIAIVSAVRGALRRIVNQIGQSSANAAFRSIQGPHLQGRGGIAAIVNRGFRNITRAANQRGRSIADEILGPVGNSAGIGPVSYDVSSGGKTPASWARDFLRNLGIRATGQDLRAIVGWEKAEGGHWANSARFNPLNTTLNMPGAVSINSVGVKAYRSWQQGMRATVQTIKNSAYSGIIAALRDGRSAMSVADAIGSSPWGTNAALIHSAIGGVRLAQGGPVKGAGTSTSDSIVARLTPGEHVWTAT